MGPAIIIVIVIGVIAGLVFSPAGDILSDILEQAGITDPEAYEIQNPDQEEQLEKEVVGGFETFIDEMIEVGSDLGQESIDASEFEGNPLGMTKKEAEKINETGKDFFHAFAQVFFKGHAFIVAVIDGFSPVEMGVAFVSIVALLVSIFLIFGHSKHIVKHWARIVMVISFFILFFLVLGSDVSI